MYRYARNGKSRIEPFKGGKAQCQICGEAISAFCGEINRNHWRHDNLINCDNWYEPMTDWHINWQDKFPKDWREVVITKNGKKHLADVHTNQNIVIEFQHSSISTHEISEREAFYENMIWVLDAREFSDRFKITSDVKTKLRELDKDKRKDINNAELSINQDIYNQRDEIEKIERSIENNKSRILILSSQISELSNIQTNESNYIEKDIIKSWLSEEQNYSPFNPISQLLREIEPEFKSQIQSLSSQIGKLNYNIGKNSNQLKQINNLPDITLPDKVLKLIKYEWITKDNYHKVFIMNKHNKGTLFDSQREVRQFKDEFHFSSFNNTKNDEFAVDFSKQIENLTSEISDLENSLNSLEKILQTLKINIEEKLNEYIEQKTNQLEIEKTEIKDKIVELKNSLQDARLALEKLKQNKDKDLAELLESIEAEYQKRKGFVMKKYKGIYSFTWKNERKSWSVAECQLFFDIGEDYLWKRISTTQLRKIPTGEFLKIHRGTLVLG